MNVRRHAFCALPLRGATRARSLAAPLQAAQEAEQRSDLGVSVLVDAVQANEGIEDEEPRVERLDGVAESNPVLSEIEPQPGDADHVDVEAIEGDAGRSREAFQAVAHQGQSKVQSR